LANTKQAKKRARQAETHRQHNASQRSLVRTHLKTTIKAIESGNKDQAMTEYRKVASILDRYANKGQLHKKKAARHKSRLNARIKALANKA